MYMKKVVDNFSNKTETFSNFGFVFNMKRMNACCPYREPAP